MTRSVIHLGKKNIDSPAEKVLIFAPKMPTVVTALVKIDRERRKQSAIHGPSKINFKFNIVAIGLNVFFCCSKKVGKEENNTTYL